MIPDYLDDVRRLTHQLRSDPVLALLREQLRSAGVDLQQVLLAVFLENENLEEYGILVRRDKAIWRFQRKPVPPTGTSASKRLVKLEDITGNQRAIAGSRDYVLAALALVDEAGSWPT